MNLIWYLEFVIYDFIWLYMILNDFIHQSIRGMTEPAVNPATSCQFHEYFYTDVKWMACGNCFSAWNGSLRNGSITDITLIVIVCSDWCPTSASAECLTITWFPMFFCEQHHSPEYLVYRIAKFDTTQITGSHQAKVKRFFLEIRWDQRVSWPGKGKLWSMWLLITA